MSENVFYDFTLDSLVAVEAPIGTDPDTLIEKAKQVFIDRIREGDVEIVFDSVFDQKTGDYSEDWEGYCRG
jgi:uncharacterized transporter YbjL